MELPLYELLIDESKESELEVSAIALVDIPAIERNWYAFKDNVKPMNFTTIDEDEHLVVGPAMIPDLKIYRNEKDADGKITSEYNIVFSKKTVASIAEKFYAKAFQGNANIMHDQNQKADGVTYFMSFIRDTAKGMIGLEGEYPEGTWFVGAKVKNPEIWAKVKSGDIQGFSVEGSFEFTKPKMTEEEAMQKIKNILNEITE